MAARSRVSFWAYLRFLITFPPRRSTSRRLPCSTALSLLPRERVYSPDPAGSGPEPSVGATLSVTDFQGPSSSSTQPLGDGANDFVFWRSSGYVTALMCAFK